MSQFFTIYPNNINLRLIRQAVSIMRDGGIVAISGLTPAPAGSAGPVREWVILVKATAVPGVWPGGTDLGDRPEAGGNPARQGGVERGR